MATPTTDPRNFQLDLDIFDPKGKEMDAKRIIIFGGVQSLDPRDSTIPFARELANQSGIKVYLLNLPYKHPGFTIEKIKYPYLYNRKDVVQGFTEAYKEIVAENLDKEIILFADNLTSSMALAAPFPENKAPEGVIVINPIHPNGVDPYLSNSALPTQIALQTFVRLAATADVLRQFKPSLLKSFFDALGLNLDSFYVGTSDDYKHLVDGKMVFKGDIKLPSAILKDSRNITNPINPYDGKPVLLILGVPQLNTENNVKAIVESMGSEHVTIARHPNEPSQNALYAHYINIEAKTRTINWIIEFSRNGKLAQPTS